MAPNGLINSKHEVYGGGTDNSLHNVVRLNLGSRIKIGPLGEFNHTTSAERALIKLLGYTIKC